MTLIHSKSFNLSTMNRILKITFSFVLIGLISTSIISCKCCHKNSNKTTEVSKSDAGYTFGTVKKLPNLIGQCAWVIETSDGKRFETREMPQDFFVDGLKIKFKYSVIEGLKSQCQTGTIVKVSDAVKI
jgi:hypothetical protein